MEIVQATGWTMEYILNRSPDFIGTIYSQIIKNNFHRYAIQSLFQRADEKYLREIINDAIGDSITDKREMTIKDVKTFPGFSRTFARRK